jgi:NtrC-family two-component system response regulator AlgB
VQPPRVGDLCSLCDIEREHIRQILAKSPSIKESAEILGIEPSTLWRKRMKFGIGGPAKRE